MDLPTEQQVGQWYPRLFRSAWRMVGSADAAADLAQEACYRALRSWDRFDGRSPPATWLHSILVNCVRDQARKQARAKVEPFDEWCFPASSRACKQQIDRMVEQEELQRVRAAIEALPDRLRAAFVATVVDGYSYEEAGEMLGIPMGTVASRVHEARKVLNGAMRKWYREEVRP